ncbi:hypothetical protein [Amycolatopsis sp. NPDC021455]|uniref:hypothetical protein n=1 Tax=Amycolatopsis sp. NPDC021455 TaxID=3154901 RepID=UPI0033D1BCF5
MESDERVSVRQPEVSRHAGFAGGGADVVGVAGVVGGAGVVAGVVAGAGSTEADNGVLAGGDAP